MKVIATRRLIHGGALYVPGNEFDHSEGRTLEDRLRSGTVHEVREAPPLEALKTEASALLDDDTENGNPTKRRYKRRDMTAEN